MKRWIFSILTWSRRSNPLTFTRDSGRLPRDEFLVIREGYHMLICLLLGTVLQWTISSRELIRTEYGRYHQQWVWQWRSGCLILSLNYEKNLHFFLNLSSGLKIIHQFVKVDRNVYKTSNKSFMIHTNQLLLFSNWPELSPWSFTHVHVFKKIETTVRWNCMSKALRFLQLTAKHQDFLFYRTSLTMKT